MDNTSIPRNSRSPSPRKAHSRLRSVIIKRSRSSSQSPVRPESLNPGNILFVAGLSQTVTKKDLEEHFSKEGKVSECFVVVEPYTQISRRYAFVTMESVEDANRCFMHLHRTVLRGRRIRVERSRRKYPRTPTPGHYFGNKGAKERGYDLRNMLGNKGARDYGHRGDQGKYHGNSGCDQGRYHGGSGCDDISYMRSPRHSTYGGRSGRNSSGSLPHSPHVSSERKDAGESRISRSPSQRKAHSRSRSRSLPRKRPKLRSSLRSLPRERRRSHSRSCGRYESSNPGNTLHAMSGRKRPRTPTPGHYLGPKGARDYGHRGDQGRCHGRGQGKYHDDSSRDDISYQRSPRRSPRHSPYGGRSRRNRSRSLPHSPHGSPETKDPGRDQGRYGGGSGHDDTLYRRSPSPRHSP